jgi:hypothetical protein
MPCWAVQRRRGWIDERAPSIRPVPAAAPLGALSKTAHSAPQLRGGVPSALQNRSPVFPRFSGSQVRVICIPAMFPLSTTMQSLIDAWEEAQASGEWIEPAPEPIYPAAWWLIQLEEEPQELELPLRWSA